MSPRLTRAEQTERNRSLVLAAARRVFLARGYHSATLDQIAEDAGFSKGVVYSQFRSKADLFLALLEARIEERIQENIELARGVAGEEGIVAMIARWAEITRAEPEWGLLVIEFRVHAARDPETNRRYAAAHQRTIQGMSELITTLYERAGEKQLPYDPRQVAEAILAFAAGFQLEQAADPRALQGPLHTELFARLLTPSVTAGYHDTS